MQDKINLETILDKPEVVKTFNGYPKPIRENLLYLRQLVFETAAETEEVGELEETLKWGEPSYLTKGGSTIRMAWKAATPDQYALYFICTTKLVDTFKELYGDKFTFDGNRAILFKAEDNIPVDELKHCISLALTYHRRKNLSLLGV